MTPDKNLFIEEACTGSVSVHLEADLEALREEDKKGRLRQHLPEGLLKADTSDLLLNKIKTMLWESSYNWANLSTKNENTFILVFRADVKGISTIGILIYTARITTPYSESEFEWVKKRYKIARRKGEGIVEFVYEQALQLKEVQNNQILLGLEVWSDMLYLNTSPFAVALGTHIRKEYKLDKSVELAVQPSTTSYYVINKSLEVADTPTWVSISRDLGLMLLNTDVANMCDEDIKLPAPGIFIKVPDFFSFEVGGLRYTVQAIGMAQYRDRDSDLDGYIFNFYMDSSDNYLSMHQSAFAVTFQNLASLTNSEPMADYISKASEGETPWHIFGDDMKNNQDPHGSLYTLLGAPVSVIEYKNSIAKLVFNTILYINSPNADLQHRSIFLKPPKVKGRKTPKKRIWTGQEIIAGTSVKLSSTVRQTLEERTKGWKITYSFVVRGHWRNQACGKGRKDRKKKWIKPYVKGRDLATKIMGHTYQTE